MASFGLGKASSPKATKVEIDSSTPWMAASEGDLLLMQSALAALRLPVSAADENGYTLLHAAASYTHLHVMHFLVQSEGVDINARDSDGDSPLHYAGSDRAAKVLVEAGTDPRAKNTRGKTALEAKQEELDEMMQDEEIEDDDDDIETLKKLVEYLSSLR